MGLTPPLMQRGKYLFICLLFLVTGTDLNAQRAINQNFSWPESDRAEVQQDLFTRSVDHAILQIPIPGEQLEYKVKTNPYIKTISSANNPNFQTFSGRDSVNQPVFGYFNEEGVHLSIYKNGAIISISPLRNKSDAYIMTSTSDPESVGDFICGTEDLPEIGVRNGGNSKACQSQNYSSLTFNLFVACTGEWGSYYGSKSAAEQGIADHISALNALYLFELNISFNLITDNSYIYTNSSTDYFNPSNGSMAMQARSFFNTYIDDSQYDIGHVFHKLNSSGTSAAGSAYVGVTCNNSYKGGGYTSTSRPNRISFNIQIFGHEIGHQLGANHTFYGSRDNCSGSQRSNGDGFEPGSGSTLMSYEGQCGSHNLAGPQSSVLYFNTHSVSQILSRINSQSSCGFKSGSGSNISINIPRDFSIPKRTPFDLTATGGNGAYAYIWEQYDTDSRAADNTRSDPINGGNYISTPMYRSYDPSPQGNHRSFPSKDVQSSGTIKRGEVYATVARDITMRLMTRSGGVIRCDEMTVNVRNASPFVIEKPVKNEMVQLNENASGSSSMMTVEWETGDTENYGFPTIDIYYSTDGGEPYPYLLADNVPNDGEHQVRPPDVNTNTARLKIMLTDGTGQMAIYNENRGNFTVSFATLPIEIAEFSGTSSEDHHILSWTLNNTGEHIEAVNLEYSYDGIFYKTVSLADFEVLNSHSQWEDEYQSFFTDGPKTYYRLSIENVQGDKTLSAVLALKNQASDNELFKLFPNPTGTMEVQVRFGRYLNPDAKVVVWSVKGQKMYETKVALRSRSMSIPVSWPEGIYIVELQNGAERHHKKLMVK